MLFRAVNICKVTTCIHEDADIGHALAEVLSQHQCTPFNSPVQSIAQGRFLDSADRSPPESLTKSRSAPCGRRWWLALKAPSICCFRCVNCCKKHSFLLTSCNAHSSCIPALHSSALPVFGTTVGGAPWDVRSCWPAYNPTVCTSYSITGQESFSVFPACKGFQLTDGLRKCQPSSLARKFYSSIR